MIRIFIVVFINLLPDMLRCMRRGILIQSVILNSFPADLRDVQMESRTPVSLSYFNQQNERTETR